MHQAATSSLSLLALVCRGVVVAHPSVLGTPPSLARRRLDLVVAHRPDRTHASTEEASTEGARFVVTFYGCWFRNAIDDAMLAAFSDGILFQLFSLFFTDHGRIDVIHSRPLKWRYSLEYY
jgi:hypothetical protein